MKRYFKIIILSLAVILILGFIIYNSEIFNKRIFYYANVDFNINIPIGTRIYHSDLRIGRVSKIYYFLERKEKMIEFYLFEDFSFIARYNSKLILRVDEENNIRRISICIDDTDLGLLIPEREFFDSIVVR